MNIIKAQIKTLLALACVLLTLLPLQLHAFVAPAQVKLETQDWGDASPADVKAVLDSVIIAISPYMPNHKFNTILIRPSKDAPRAVYEKGANGEYIVQLQARGRQWAQFSYQFGHEMCHLMSNYDLAPNNVSHQQWFEESLCEAFGLFTLERMASQWESNPPYPNWREYAPHFIEYQHANLNQAHRVLPKGMGLPAWYQQYQATLSNDPYAQERHLNELVSNRLLPIFSMTPNGWEAINYLNLGDDSKDKTLEKYLQDWHENTPAALRAPVEMIQQLLLTKSGTQ
jgi:hypothetical protein